MEHVLTVLNHDSPRFWCHHTWSLDGPGWQSTDGVAAQLRSLHFVAQLFKSLLSPEKKEMQAEYCGGLEEPNEEDPFLELTCLEGCTGHFLDWVNITNLGFYTLSLTHSLYTIEALCLQDERERSSTMESAV